jgi:AcrR family transcriptional regulator
MSDRQDRRVRKTRDALHRALIASMTEKGYEATTVQDVIDRADVGRSTFYAHYSDKAELLQDAMSQLRELLATATPNGPASRRRPLRFSLELFRHVHEQRTLLRALVFGPGAGPVLAAIDEIVAGLARAELESLMNPDVTPRAPIELIIQTVVAAVTATLRWWVNEDMASSPEQVDAWLQTLLAPGLRAALPPPVG